MLTDPNFVIRLTFGFLFWLVIFLIFAKIISKFKKKPVNGAKAYLWCLGLLFIIGAILFIRGIFLNYWSEYDQGQIIGIMLYGFTIPFGVTYYLHKRFLRKHKVVLNTEDIS